MGTYYVPEPVTQIELAVGDIIRFAEESRYRWTVRAVVDGVTVVTRQAQFKPKGTLLYSVIHWTAGVRGPVNVIGQGWEVDTDEKCQELADLVAAGEWEVSQRNWLRINIVPTKAGA